MSPKAMTAAARGTAARARRPAAAPARRRVNGERPAPALPRRQSGPATGRAQPSPHRQAGVGARLLLVVRSLPDHSLLDRIVRGRWWIPLLGVLLAGIVATQVEVLRLNASMGRALKQSSSLAIRNQALRTSVAELSDDARIERLAVRMGMVMPDPTTLSFVPANGGPMRAVQNIHAPSPDQFVAQLPSASSADTSSGNSASGAGTSGTSSGSASSGDTSGGSSGSASSGDSSGGSSGSASSGDSSGASSGATSG